MTNPDHMKNLFKDLQQEIVETNEWITDMKKSIQRLEKRLEQSQEKRGYEHPLTTARVLSHQRSAMACLQTRLKMYKQKAAALQV